MRLNLSLLTKYPVLIRHGKMRETDWLVMRMQLKLHMMRIEDIVPQNHFVQKLEPAVDLSFVHEETRTPYSYP